jgi:hypothetical protein
LPLPVAQVATVADVVVELLVMLCGCPPVLLKTDFDCCFDANSKSSHEWRSRGARLVCNELGVA